MSRDTAPDPREAKLPRWAQDQLRYLRQDLAEARELVTELKGTRPDAVAYRDRLLDRDQLVPVAWVNDRIRFLLDGHTETRRRSIDIYRDHAGRGLSIRTTDGLISVHPESGNAIYVDQEERR